MFVGVWISPAALGAVVLAVTLGLRAPWWAVLLTVAVSAALAVAAAMRIGAWYDRRATLATARWPVQQQLRAEVIEPVAPPRRVTASGGVTINLINPAPGQYEEIVRRAISGPDGGTSPAAVRPGP